MTCERLFLEISINTHFSMF